MKATESLRQVVNENRSTGVLYDSSSDSLSTDKRRFIQILQEKMGVLYAACSAAGYSHESVMGWIGDDPIFAASVQRCKEVALDFVESKLFQKINEGDTRLIQFFLETQGKQRGYVRRKELKEVDPLAVILTPEESVFLQE